MTVQLAAKQLLKLGVKPEVVVRHEELASQAGLSLREHVQKLLRDAAVPDPHRCEQISADGTGRCMLEPLHPGEHVFKGEGLPEDYWETAQ